MQNATPSRGKTDSPVYMAFQRRENFTKLFTFGCRIWVRPPCPNNRRQKGKLNCDSLKGIFLGYEDDTTKNVLWYDVATNQVKSACHFSCDEMSSDLLRPTFHLM